MFSFTEKKLSKGFIMQSHHLDFLFSFELRTVIIIRSMNGPGFYRILRIKPNRNGFASVSVIG